MRLSPFLLRRAEVKRRRTRVVGVFPAVNSCLRLVGMILLEQHEDWLTQKYMAEESLKDLYTEEVNSAVKPRRDWVIPDAGVELPPVFKREKELVMV